MVQEYVSPVRVHKYSFEMVMAAYERRFPSCPQIPVVVECAISDDSWSQDDSVRQTTRRCQLNVEAPYLLKKMIGVDYIYFVQKNHLDLKSRVLEIEATNETFAARVGVVEKCKYYVHPENSEWTCFEQSALLDVKNFFGLESTVEKIAMKQYAANIAKGKELIESFMKEVHADGVMDLRPWSPTDVKYNRELRRILARGAEPLSPRAAPDAQIHAAPGTSKHAIAPRSSYSRASLAKPQPSPPLAARPKTSTTAPAAQRSSSTRKISQILHREGPTRPNLERTVDHSVIDIKKPTSRPFLRSRQSLIDEPAKELKTVPPSIERGMSFSRQEEHKDLKKKVRISQPDLTVATDDEDERVFRKYHPVEGPEVRSCDCLQPYQSLVHVLTRWDSLLLVVVCAIALMVLMSAPLSIILRLRRDR